MMKSQITNIEYQRLAVLAGLERQLRKCTETSLAEKAHIYGSTATRYGLHGIANPFVAKDNESESEMDYGQGGMSAEDQLRAAKRQWQAEAIAKAHRNTVSLVISGLVFGLGVGAALGYLWKSWIGNGLWP